MSSILLYKGPSRFDGSPIAAVLTDSSSNRKTGSMPTLWIIRTDVAPNEAANQGLDSAVCGDCPSRKGGSDPRCYTHSSMLAKAVSSIYRTVQRGGYPDCSGWSAQQLAHWLHGAAWVKGAKAVRSAGYGDVAALPPEVWNKLDDARKLAGLGVRGYTHQWRDPELQHLRLTHMASVATPSAYKMATQLGWRTFYAVPGGMLPPDDTVLCPASDEAGHLTSCSECKLCSGLSARSTKSVYIADHGPSAAGQRLKTYRQLSIGKTKVGAL